MKTVFSGIQPTGTIHLGTYLGAIKNWKNIIDNNSSSQFFFSIVDLHAITIHQNPQELRDAILGTFAMYVACGIDGDNITVFQQSAVSQHTELAWVLSCNLQMGFLDRMTQYKEKTHQNKERACLGLYSYPVLMASDILLYNTNIVPVGEDQIQHIELARDIAIKFNSKYGKEVFTLPEYVLTKAKRVMSLKDGTKKMSKSDDSDLSRINLLDTPETITRKIQKAKTGEAEMHNLTSIYEALTGEVPQIRDGMVSIFKKHLVEVIVKEFEPIQQKFFELMKERDSLVKLLERGGQSAQVIAKKNLGEVYKTIGLS